MFILILGLGRTGGYLASKLVAQGHHVIGTSRTPNPKNLPGIEMVHWQSEMGTMDLPEADVVISAFPPTETYSMQLAALRLRYPEKMIIHISSTAVFAPDQGVVHEYTRPVPLDARGKLLLEAEDIILQHPLGRVVRAGGLYDETSHPVHSLVNKEVGDPKAYVNLVHRHDVADILFQMVSGEIDKRIVHAVHPEHPTKEEFYTEKAKALGLPAPKFVSAQRQGNRIVMSSLERSWRPL